MSEIIMINDVKKELQEQPNLRVAIYKTICIWTSSIMCFSVFVINTQKIIKHVAKHF